MNYYVIYVTSNNKKKCMDIFFQFLHFTMLYAGVLNANPIQ